MLMKVFQLSHTFTLFNEYLEHKYDINNNNYSFKEFQKILFDEGFNAVHQLLPVLDTAKGEGFFTLWNYKPMQLKWAQEKGWSETDLKKILWAQIEEFGGDVFYNLSPIQFSANEIKSIPGKMVKIAWFASPEKNNIDFSIYKTRFTNLPSDVDSEAKRGFRSDFFQLSDAPVFQSYANNQNRAIDVLFFGQYLDSYFDKRNSYINDLIRLQEKHGFILKLALMANYRYKNPLPFNLPFGLHQKFKILQFPPKKVVKYASPAIFGAEMLENISNSKIVFNCHVDIAGDYRVNMRIFEVLGCGTHLLSDAGIYPEGLQVGKHFSVYNDFASLEANLLYLLQDTQKCQQIASSGNEALRKYYSKEHQWIHFQHLISLLV